MKRLLVAGSIVMGILICYLVLRGIAWYTGPRPQYPVYPHADQLRMHPALQSRHLTLPAQLEFHTSDSAAQVRAFYTARLLQDRWILTHDDAQHLVFQRSWPSYELREELTLTLWVQTPQESLTGTIVYRTEPFLPCGPPVLC